jgi:tetratricopeptide (TPR) repeat protein
MKKPQNLPIHLLVLLSITHLTVFSPSVFAGIELKKNWYLSRAKSNMEIGNYKAAIEAYEKVLEEDPDNSDVMRTLGKAYESQGMKDKAIAQYDRYLEKNPHDADMAFHQAESLEWSRYSYRRQDALKYYKMGLEEKNDPQKRLKYARLLAANQQTNSEAIDQYRTVLRSQPRNGEAHAGLARAYAWDGKNDRALYHSQLAKDYGTSHADLKRLNSDLNRGREPMAGGLFQFVTQPGGNYEYTGFQLSALGRMDISPYITAKLQAGLEDYWTGSNQTSNGGFISLGSQFRFDEERLMNLSLGYHSIAPITPVTQGRNGTALEAPGINNVALKMEYQQRSQDFTFTPGFERTLRKDSFLAFAGSRQSGTLLGAARSHQLYSDLTWKNENLEYGVKPYLGWITASGLDTNPFVGADVKLDYRFFQTRSFALWGGHMIQAQHYSLDQSDQNGISGAGYFSPQLYLNQHPHFLVRFKFSDRYEADASAGPSVQFVNDLSLPGKWLVGANFNANLNIQLASHFQWRTGGGYIQVADKFNQFQISNQVNYIF